MLGSNVGNLELYVITDNKLQNSTSILTLNGTQAQKWLRKNIYISQDDINYDFIVAIDAVLGIYYNGTLISVIFLNLYIFYLLIYSLFLGIMAVDESN